jgi:hypothetical protein
MTAWLHAMPTELLGVVVVGGFVAVTMLFGYTIVKAIPHAIRFEHNDLAGFILAVIGVVYAVLLAFVAIGVWERFDQAEVRTYHEAGMLTVVYRDAGSFGAKGHALRSALHAYTERVISDEWPGMRRGGYSVAARTSIEAIDADVRALPVTNASQQNVQAQMLASLERSLVDRDQRIALDATGINSVLWTILIVGGFVTVTFTYLFGFKHSLMRHLMIGGLSLTIGLVLFLTVALDYPFRGGATVEPTAFENALRVFGHIGP